MTDAQSTEERLRAIERQLDSLNSEMAALRSQLATEGARARDGSGGRAPSHPAHARHSAPEFIRQIHTQDVERALGRYGMLVLAVLAAVAAVGTFLSWAISHGYIVLGPAARVSIGVVAAIGIGIWGMVLRRRERSFGSSMVALALVILLVCAYAAGPSFHLLPLWVAFAIVAVTSVALTAFAYRENDEPLWCVGFGGATATPYVTSQGRGNVFALVAYATLLLTLAPLAIGPRRWPMARRIFYIAAALLVTAAAGAAYDGTTAEFIVAFAVPFVVAIAGVLPAAGPSYVRGMLRWLAVLAVGASLAATPQTSTESWAATTALLTAFVIWLAIMDLTSAVPQSSTVPRLGDNVVLLERIDVGLLPIAFAARALQLAPVANLALLQACLAMGLVVFGWRRPPSAARDASAMAAIVLAMAAVVSLRLEQPASFVAGFVALALAFIAMHALRPSLSWLTGGLGTLLFTAITSTMAMLDRIAYRFVPFRTKASVSALVLLAGLIVLSRVWRMIRRATRAAMWDRPEWTYARQGELLLRAVTLAPWVWAFVWVLLELSMAFSPSTSTLALVVYFASTAVACVAAGRARHAPRLRQVGLGLGIAAAMTAFYGASTYFDVGARILAYLVTSAFLLGIAYWYRRPGAAPVTS